VGYAAACPSVTGTPYGVKVGRQASAVSAPASGPGSLASPALREAVLLYLASKLMPEELSAMPL